MAKPNDLSQLHLVPSGFSFDISYVITASLPTEALN